MERKISLKKIAVIAAILMAAGAAVFFFVFSQRLTATTMRLLKTKGIVKLFEKEKEKTIVDNLRLANGNAISTESDSLASIALDDHKIVTINDLSRAQFEQSGKKLNINLTDGSLFFEVTEKLKADETFDIRTSSMVVGIRGTSGYVAVDEEGHETLYITDGEVEVIGTNPVTKEQKVIKVRAGQRIRIYLYNDRPKDSIMFTLENVTEDDLKQAIKDRLIENDPLMAKVCNATGWDKNKIIGIEEIPENVVPTAPSEEAATAASTSTEKVEDTKVENNEETVEPEGENKVEGQEETPSTTEPKKESPKVTAPANDAANSASSQATNSDTSQNNDEEAYKKFQEDLARAMQEQADQAEAERLANEAAQAAQAAQDNNNNSESVSQPQEQQEPQRIDDWGEPDDPDNGDDPNNGDGTGGDGTGGDNGDDPTTSGG